MIKVEVNTTILKSEVKFTMRDDETLRDLLTKVGAKIGDSFMNQKLYVLLPIFKH